jgi:DNA-binding IclR family transcriptional regulator
MNSEKMDGKKQKGIQSIHRVAAILDYIVKEGNNVSLSDMSRGLGLGKSTVHGFLSTLKDVGYVKQLSEGGNYSLDLKLFELGQAVYNSMDLGKIVKPFLEQLSAEYGETVHLAVLSENEIIYLDKVSGTYAINMMSRRGARREAYCTAIGKALLAGRTDAEVRDIMKGHPIKQYTSNTVKSCEDLIADIENTRRRGYAIDDEEVEIGLRCVGAGIQDSQGKVIAAVSIAGPVTRMTRERIAERGLRILQVSKEISWEMGYRPSKFESESS